MEEKQAPFSVFSKLLKSKYADYISTFEFQFEINITQGSYDEIKKHLEERLVIYSSERQRIDYLHNDILLTFIQESIDASSAKGKYKIYITNYAELDGSFLITFKLIVDTLGTFSTLKEITEFVEKIASDLDSELISLIGNNFRYRSNFYRRMQNTSKGELHTLLSELSSIATASRRKVLIWGTLFILSFAGNGALLYDDIEGVHNISHITTGFKKPDIPNDETVVYIHEPKEHQDDIKVEIHPHVPIDSPILLDGKK